MELSIDIIKRLVSLYGDSFYLLNSNKFVVNFNELLSAFRNLYQNTFIAYSYKTNYIPKLCKLVNRSGGYAEVVSDMEYFLAKKVGVRNDKIFFNGPYKKPEAVQELLLNGGIVNLDSEYDLKLVINIARSYPKNELKVGLRCNFDINDNVTSRFGFDVKNSEIDVAFNKISEIPNIKLEGLHCHFASRDLGFWPIRAKTMISLVKKFFNHPPAFISLGGGLFGRMPDSLKSQFNSKIPSYYDYAEAVAPIIERGFSKIPVSQKPMLIIEPGSAIVGDTMRFVTKVIDIRQIRGKSIATLSGSMHNINPTLSSKNLPVIVFHDPENADNQENYKNLDFSGYTCIESDYLYRGYDGELSVNDYVVFDNAGSYSVVLKPPFILPNFPILEYHEDTKEIELVKRQEKFEDIFNAYSFS
jgi:diaminopimelate decarboxylase